MKKSLSIIGVGAFGEFMLKHVAPHFDVTIHDAGRELSSIAATYQVSADTVEQAAKADFIVLAVPVKAIASVIDRIKPFLKPGQVVMDIASVKCLPVQIMTENLPDFVDIIGLHPLFGPQSGKDGIQGKNIVVSHVRGTATPELERFLTEKLHLNVISCTAEQHDQQMAYVQGLTHLIAKVYQTMNVPEITQETKTFALLREMVDLVKNDSDDLFRAIQNDNPYSLKMREDFLSSFKAIEEKL